MNDPPREREAGKISIELSGELVSDGPVLPYQHSPLHLIPNNILLHQRINQIKYEVIINKNRLLVPYGGGNAIVCAGSSLVHSMRSLAADEASTHPNKGL